MELPKGKVDELLLRGLEDIVDNEEFEKRSGQIKNAAFARIIEGTRLDIVKWQRLLGDGERYMAEATVEDASGDDVTLPVFLYTSYDSWGDHKSAYLQLGNMKDGPCLNSGSREVRLLSKHHFGIRGLPIRAHYINDEAGKGLEYLARLTQFGSLKPLDFEQLKGFPLRLTIRKTGLFSPWNKVNSSDFESAAQIFLQTAGQVTQGQARYTVIMDANSPDADEVPVEDFFAYDCATHRALKRTESLSLQDIDSVFDVAKSLQVGVRNKSTDLDQREDLAVMNYLPSNPSRISVFAEGGSEFKFYLGQGLRKANLPFGYKLESGY